MIHSAGQVPFLVAIRRGKMQRHGLHNITYQVHPIQYDLNRNLYMGYLPL